MPSASPQPAPDSTRDSPTARGFSALATWTCIAVLIATVALAYRGSVGGTFALDDSHTIQNNPWVRSLANVPRYFTDASTFSTLSTNVDYRPVLQTTYALNYQLARATSDSGSGYDTRTWNIVNLAVHALVTVWVFLLGRRLFGAARGGAASPLAGISARDGDVVSLCGALLFAVHPAFSGAVNYTSGRSSTLVAALVLPVLLVYLRSLKLGSRPVLTVTACVLYTLALLTKIEAVALLGVLALAELLFNPDTRAWPITARIISGRGFARLLPFAVISVLAVALWQGMSPLQSSSTRAGEGITPLVYLSTQVHAWWYYVGQLVAPVDQMVENLQYPVTRWVYDVPGVGLGGVATTERAVQIGVPEALTLFALAGWLIVLACLSKCLRGAPAIALLGLSFFIFISPHSSVVPLAEMVNEHRPYLPLACVTLLAAIGLFLLVRTLTATPARALLILTVMLAIPLAMLTQRRHAVWQSEFALWEDNARKQPEASRVQMNYGLALMQAGRMVEAEERFRRAVSLSPNYAWAHLNLAICLARQGLIDDARRSFDTSVSLTHDQEVPRYWRARFLAEQRELTAAAADLREAIRINPGVVGQRAALIEVLVAAGMQAEADAQIATVNESMRATLDDERSKFRLEVRLDESVDARVQRVAADLQRDGLAFMGNGQWSEAESRFRAAALQRPDWVYPIINLGIALAGAGRSADAEAEFDRALGMEPTNADAHFYRGRYLAQRTPPRWAEAIDAFTQSAAHAGDPTTALAYLCESLIAAGRQSEADAVIGRVTAQQRSAFDAARAEFTRVVLKR